MNKRPKYKFADGGDNDFFNSILDNYQQLQPQTQPDESELYQNDSEENVEQPDQQGNNQDYEDLLQKYQDLEDKLTAYTNGVQVQSADNHDYGDGFLNFLFTDNSDNSPIDWAQLSQTIAGQNWPGAKTQLQSRPQTQSQPSQQSGGFKSFSSPEEGRQALVHQLDLYKTGKTRNNVRPTSTLLEAMHVYAPASDKNNPDQYAKFIANKLGVTPQTPISQIDTTKWADAITQMEGNKSGNNPGNIRRQYGGGLQQANEEAKRFAVSKGLIFGEEAHVDHIPQYIDGRTGKPYQPLPTKSASYSVPNDIQLGDIQSYQGKYWYTDPKTGDVVDVDPSVLSLPKFKKPTMKLGGKYKFADVESDQINGLNDSNYNEMTFPMKGVNEFRGLDSGKPVYLEDQTGRSAILRGPLHTAKMVGRVHEKRI